MFSTLLLRGRCRYCKERIPGRVLFVELASGALFAFIAFRYAVAVEALVVLAFVSVLVVVLVVDLEKKLILNKVICPSLAVALLVVPWGPVGHNVTIQDAYLEALKGLLLGGGVLFVIYLLARGGFGVGDVTLGALLGLMVGFIPMLVALQISFVVGGMVAVVFPSASVAPSQGLHTFRPFPCRSRNGGSILGPGYLRLVSSSPH